MGIFDWLKGKKKAPGPAGAPEKDMVEIGRISHFFPHPCAAVIELKATLKVGDRIAVRGHTTSFEQVVESMQIDNADITEAGKGKAIGVKVKEKVRGGDVVYKL